METVLENTTSDNPDTLSLEELSEHSELERVVENPKCEICGKEEMSTSDMMEHMEIHTFRCDSCVGTFSSKESFEKHQQEVHSVPHLAEVHSVPSLAETDEPHLDLENQEKPAGHQEDQVLRQQVQGEPQPINNENIDNIFEVENTKLKKENEFLRNRFEQARNSYNELEKEVDEVRKHYDEELSETRSNYEKIKGELEHLRESNDLLKKIIDYSGEV